MGAFNSSITRVWPVFGHLLSRDPSGASWLGPLLRLAECDTSMSRLAPGRLLPDVSARTRAIPRNMRGILGEEGCAAFEPLPAAFEAEFAPPSRFMRWLLENPQNLVWPTDKKGVRLRYGEAAHQLRERLIAGDENVHREGVAMIAGGKPARRAWWTFEGWTSVDCWLETEGFVLFIEGKRTEPISAATAWYPARNQVVRNLEVAAAYAHANQKEFAVMVCAEHHVSLPRDCFDLSLPHLDAAERAVLRERYLGCVTWKQIRDALCPELQLPHTVAEAVSTCLRFLSP